jgi:hypothetical protein
MLTPFSSNTHSSRGFVFHELSIHCLPYLGALGALGGLAALAAALAAALSSAFYYLTYYLYAALASFLIYTAAYLIFLFPSRISTLSYAFFE